MKRIFALLLAMMLLMSSACAEEMVLFVPAEAGAAGGMADMEMVMEPIVVGEDVQAPLDYSDMPGLDFSEPEASVQAPDAVELPETSVIEDESGVLPVEMAAAVEAAEFEPLKVHGAAVNRTQAYVGQTITWTVSATGGNGDYAYFFNLFNGDTVVKYGDWQLEPTFSWTPETPGNYYVAAYAVDSRWVEIAGPASEGGLVPVKNYEPLAASLSANVASANVGDTITWTIKPSGGNGDYAYFYNIFCGDQVVHYGDWQLDPSISWTPTFGGNYYVAGYVVDSRWVEIAQAPEGGLVPVTIVPLTVVSATCNNTSPAVGATVNFEVAVTGGTGIYAYAYTMFKLNPATGAYDYLAETPWDNRPGCAWTVGAEGSYKIVCNVMDSAGTLTIYTWNITTGSVMNPGGKVTLRINNTLPMDVRNYDGDTKQHVLTMNVTSARYGQTYDSATNTCDVEINFGGVKTYDYYNSTLECCVGWRVYDANGTMLKSGIAVSGEASVGGSVTATDVIYDLPAGGTYYIALAAVNL